MKHLRRTGGAILLGAIVLGSLQACKKDKDEQEYNISGTLSGSQEVPAVTTTGSGTISGEYDGDDNKLELNVNWTGLSGTVTGAHIHGPALTGASAGVLIPLTVTVNGVTGKIETDVSLPDSTEQFLLQGRLYVNLHTTLNPNGEVRGQITAVKD